MQATTQINSKVAGTTFRSFDWSKLRESDTLEVRPEPTNAYDKNALMLVHAEAGHIGYVNARLAADLADNVRQGDKLEAYVNELTGGTDDCPNRGINIVITVSRPVAL